jgi:hypothetical protein
VIVQPGHTKVVRFFGSYVGKAAMVSNLLVVVCADQPASPVVNAGTLYT